MTRIDQEPDYVPKRPIDASAAIAVAAIIISIVTTIALMHGRVSDTLHITTQSPQRVETDSFLRMTRAERLRAETDQHLRSYGWVDRSQGTIFVPLDVAIESYLGAAQ
jgi:hypothetical protein